MYDLIYGLPLPWFGAFAFLAVLLWAVLGRITSKTEKSCRIWQQFNIVLLWIAVGLTIWMALLRRSPGDVAPQIITEPFQSIRLRYIQPEQTRLITLNVLVFLPFGLTLSAALPRTWNRWARIAAAVLAGALFSLLIESAQYLFALGISEVDDLIYNTAGAAWGALHLLFVPKPQQKQETTV